MPVKHLIRTILSSLLLLLAASPLFAQNTAAGKPDDMPFALVMGIIFIGVMAGAVIVGSLAMLAALLVISALITAGILSASIMAGLYKKSVTAAFRTFTMIVCVLGGICTGLLVCWVVNRMFSLHFTHTTIALAGAASGLFGGLLLGGSILFIIRLFTTYIKKKIAF